MRLYRSLPTYNPKYQFSTWTVRITRNLCVDRLRQKRPEHTAVDDIEEVSDEAGNPEEHCIERERTERIRQALGELPEEYRTPVILFHQQGMSYEAIAQVLGEPMTIVKNRLYRARLMLRNSLKLEQEREVTDMKECTAFKSSSCSHFDRDISEGERRRSTGIFTRARNAERCSQVAEDILGTLEQTVPMEPPPALVQATLDRLMPLPDPLYRAAPPFPTIVYGTMAGIAALLLLIVSVVVESASFADVLLAGRHYLDLFSGVIVGTQVIYQILSSLFSSAILSWLVKGQVITVVLVVMSLFIALRTVVAGPAETAAPAEGQARKGLGDKKDVDVMRILIVVPGKEEGP